MNENELVTTQDVLSDEQMVQHLRELRKELKKYSKNQLIATVTYLAVELTKVKESHARENSPDA